MNTENLEARKRSLNCLKKRIVFIAKLNKLPFHLAIIFFITLTLGQLILIPPNLTSFGNKTILFDLLATLAVYLITKIIVSITKKRFIKKLVARHAKAIEALRNGKADIKMTSNSPEVKVINEIVSAFNQTVET